MEIFGTRLLFLFMFLLYLNHVLSEEPCKTCKPIYECPRFREMTNELQEEWRRLYTCDGFTKNNENPNTKRDIICCPTSTMSDNNKNKSETEPTVNSGNPQTPSLNSFYNFGIDDDNYGYNDVYGFDDNYDACPQTSTPPSPGSGCCGVDMSGGDSLPDVQQYFDDQSYNSLWSSLFERRRGSTKSEDEIEDDLDDRVAGGYETYIDQYPWMAFLYLTFMDDNEQTIFNCGGSLISSNFILTAAHCVVSTTQKLTKVDVIISEYDRRTFPWDCTFDGKEECIENFRIPAVEVIVHPRFNSRFLINDIALLRLRDSVPYTKYIRPVCLPPIDVGSEEFANLRLAVAGWGLNVTVASNIKQFTIVHMVPNTECSEYYSALTEGHICASGKRSEDSCRGDSGGPLMMLYRGQYYLAGIVSGKTAAFVCGTPVPSLYTNVFTYLDWIRNYVR